jgi:2-iminobutanoate/2-iminopropanoate deaminase
MFIRRDIMNQKEINNKEKLAEIKGPYVHAMKCGDFIFSTQIGNRSDGILVGEGIYEQTIQTLKNVEICLNEAGAGLDDIVKCTIFVTDMNDFDELNRAYRQMFNGQPLPVRSCVQVAALYPGLKVEIEAIAYIGK